MGKEQNIIEVNGNRYDSVTGELIKPLASHPKSKIQASGGRNVDGFVRRNTATPKAGGTHTQNKPSHAIHTKTQPTKTLMRHAVKKPAVADIAQKPQLSSLKTDSGAILDTARLYRAQKIVQNRLVSRFGGPLSRLDKKITHVPVKPVPTHTAHGMSMPIEDVPPPATDNFDLPLNTFDLALQQANSHEQPRLKKPTLKKRFAERVRMSPRALTIALGLVATLLIAGFLTYQHLPQFALRVAATRAGVDASLPGYSPSGFSLNGPVQYSPGQVTLEYHSNSDNRSFRVVQKKSDWTSQSLLENFITSNKRNYQTFQDKGKTIYIYNGSNATWVSGGVWYQIEGESSLSSDQLLRIISSL